MVPVDTLDAMIEMSLVFSAGPSCDYFWISQRPVGCRCPILRKFGIDAGAAIDTLDGRKNLIEMVSVREQLR